MLKIEDLEKRIEVLEKGNIKDFEVEVTQEITAKTLKWSKCSDIEMNWFEAEEWCKKQGGRLPTQIELLQAYEEDLFGEKGGVNRYYWSGTTYSSSTVTAWATSLSTGYTSSTNKLTSAFCVRCVRF